MREINFSIYRYNPEVDKKPHMQGYTLSIEDDSDMMLLEALCLLKKQDESLSFRRSCGEGVCGSDGMNINGKNGLACVTSVSSLGGTITLRPLPGLPVIRDLVVDMTKFYKQYEKAEPYLQNTDTPPVRERLQSPEDAAKLEGLYECILCACCSTSCPSFWWNPDLFMGPAALLQAWRFVVDSRDNQTKKRLDNLKDAYSVYRCRGIMNCVDVCPKDLNPTKAIDNLREQLLENDA
jgi:succinate dehydrogenase / fumarate reductase iron-sulfur subunit